MWDLVWGFLRWVYIGNLRNMVVSHEFTAKNNDFWVDVKSPTEEVS